MTELLWRVHSGWVSPQLSVNFLFSLSAINRATPLWACLFVWVTSQLSAATNAADPICTAACTVHDMRARGRFVCLFELSMSWAFGVPPGGSARGPSYQYMSYFWKHRTAWTSACYDSSQKIASSRNNQQLKHTAQLCCLLQPSKLSCWILRIWSAN